MFIKYFSFSLFLIFLLTGCSYKNDVKIVYSDKYIDNYDDQPLQSASLEHTLKQKYKKTKTTKNINEYKNYDDFSQTENLNEQLLSFYEEWQGVRYKLGGDSKSGIDCSALIQKAFEDKLDLKIPRTTILQSEMGTQINKSQLETGDLVFFKTGRNSRHVGIYLENGNFLHASTKRGVMISNLDNSYFKKHYWKSQRIID